MTNERLASLVALTGERPKGKVGWTDVSTFTNAIFPRRTSVRVTRCSLTAVMSS